MPDPISNLLQKHRDDMLMDFDKMVDRLDELAAVVESLDLHVDRVSTVDRLCEKPAIWIKADVPVDKTISEVAKPILVSLANVGIRLDAKNGDCPYDDYGAIGRREWKLAEGKVFLALFVESGDGAKCTYRKTGTKTEDVYEIVCE
jgi:hypothetical protein